MTSLKERGVKTPHHQKKKTTVVEKRKRKEEEEKKKKKTDFSALFSLPPFKVDTSFCKDIDARWNRGGRHVENVSVTTTMQFGTPLSFLQSSLMQILSRNTTIINNYYYGGGRRGRGQGRDQVASIPDVADDPHQSALMYLHVSEVSRGVVKTALNEE